MAAPVFVSYSHKDKDWLERCRPYLRPLHRDGLIELWDDTRIAAGEQWRPEIQAALQRAKVAVLLVSQNFLDSDFIDKHELPPLLEAAKQRGLTILWLPLRHSTYKHTPLNDYQSASDPGRPLNALPESEVDLILTRLNDLIRKAADVEIPITSEGKTIFFVPYERNPVFTGRQDVLAQLDRDLLQGSGAVSQTAGILGLGGVGKTQTAVEYVYRHRDQYTAVLWVIADSEQTLASGYAEIARKLGLAAAAEEQNHDKVRDAVKKWLEQHEGWLLVLDNADTPALVKDYLPHQHRGCVLLTSRAYSLQELGIRGPVRLDALSPAEAYSFLFSRTERDASKASAEEKAAATALVQELGYLPLALEQAAAYLVETGASFAAYLASYRKRRLQLLEAGKAHARTDSVATTWILNFAEVEKTPASADLLRLSAFLAPDAIPLDLLAGGASQLDIPLGIELARASDDPLILDELLRPLLRYSLIKRDPGAPSFSVHRLIQAVLREQLNDEQRKLWTERAIVVLNAVFPATDFENWSTYDRLLPHAQVAAEAIARYDLRSLHAARLIYQAGLYLFTRGRYEAAEPLLRGAVAAYERTLGPAHRYTLDSLTNLANALQEKGDLEAAEPLLRDLVRRYEEALGPSDAHTAIGFVSLAFLLYTKGDLNAAEPLYRAALEVLEHAGKAYASQTVRCLNNLGRLLADRGKVAEAESLYRRAMKMSEEQFSADHPDMGLSLNNLATVLERSDPEAAEPLYRRALPIYEQGFGPTHSSTITVRNNLIRVLRARGLNAEAEALQQGSSQR